MFAPIPGEKSFGRECAAHEVAKKLKELDAEISAWMRRVQPRIIQKTTNIVAHDGLVCIVKTFTYKTKYNRFYE